MDINLPQIGYVIKQERKAKSWSQQQLADYVGVDQATISRIEKGNENITFEIYEKALMGLNIFYEEDSHVFSDLLHDVYNALDEFELGHMETAYKKAMKLKVNFQEFAHYLLLSAYYYIGKEDLPQIEEMVKKIKIYIHLFDGYLLSKANHVFGLYYFMINKTQKAYEYLSLAFQTSERNQYEDALIYYHYATINYVMLHHTTSILALEKAKELYIAKKNRQRVYGLCNLTGLIHINDSNYELAKQTFITCLGNQKMLLYRHQYFLTLTNLGMTYFYMEAYEKAIHCFELVYKKEKYKTKTTLFFLSLSFKYLKNEDKLTSILKDVKKILGDKWVDFLNDEQPIRIFNKSLIHDLELIIGRYNVYAFSKWLLAKESADIYHSRQYSVYKNLFDTFLELKVQNDD